MIPEVGTCQENVYKEPQRKKGFSRIDDFVSLICFFPRLVPGASTGYFTLGGVNSGLKLRTLWEILKVLEL